MELDDETIHWLLDSDPAIRWQVECDLSHAPPAQWRATRGRVPIEGFGARLLALQDPEGTWAGGASLPAWEDERAHDPAEGLSPLPHVGPLPPPQPWIATTWSLNSLREWGVRAEVLGDTERRLRLGCRWEHENLPYWDGEVDCCLNAWTLANGTWLGAEVRGLERWLVRRQLGDGGWNCEWVAGNLRSSFHSTLNVLTGLLERELHGGADAEDVYALREARHRGEQYLLERHLLHRRSTGEDVGSFVSAFAYPFRAQYSALRAADHFRRAAVLDDAVPDERLAEAIELIRSKRGADGRWHQDFTRPGLVWFDVDVHAGEASRWLTLYASRVLAWWDGAGSGHGDPDLVEGAPTAI